MNCYFLPFATTRASRLSPGDRIAAFPMNSLPSSTPRALALATLLLALVPRGRAENGISYKYADYQEAGGRIEVQTQGAYLEGDVGLATKVKVEGILDSIAGATPNGQPAPAGSTQVPLSSLTEERKAWNAEFSHQLKWVHLAAGVGNSRESDYISTGLSLNTTFDFNQKNTTLLVGFAGTKDDIKVFHQTAWARKDTRDVIIGVNQLLDPNTSVGLNLTWGRQLGYLSDPYKLVQKNTEVFPGLFLPLTFSENRPAEREKWIALATLNRAFPERRAAVDLAYRYYHDTYNTNAHTVDVAWLQRCGEKFILRPSFRFYRQSAAFFYRYTLDGTNITPLGGPPRRVGPFYSSDYRLSAMQTFTYGLKAIFQPHERVTLDAAFEKYDMRGRDVTPDSAYCEANIVTVGLKYSW